MITVKKYTKSAILFILDAIAWLCSKSLNRMIIWVIVLIGGPVVFLHALPEFLSNTFDIIERSYQHFGRSFAELFESGEENRGKSLLDDGSLPYIFTTVVGVVFGVAVTIAAVILTVMSTRSENRKQSTIKILLEARMSKDFQADLALIQIYFPTGRKASPNKYQRLSRSPRIKEMQAATALLQMLNYYEFIGTGIRKGNLDSSMTKETIRGLLCRLVFDMRGIIRHYRVTMNQPKTFKDIVALYWLWVDKDQKSEFDEIWARDRRCLGPPPPYSWFLAKCRSALLMW